MGVPKPKSEFDLNVDNYLDAQRTKIRLAQRIQARTEINNLYAETLDLIQRNALPAVEVFSDESSETDETQES